MSVFATRRSVFFFAVRVLLLLLPFFACADLLLFDFAFEPELFFFAVELVRRFLSESAPTARGAAALKQINAARGSANLIIFTK